jgi:hypothetical protein
MKQLLIATLILTSLLISRNDAGAQEHHGNTFNLGIGVAGHSGYSRYAGRSLPAINVNYEFQVAQHFTLAPSISIYSYSEKYHWSNVDYRYHETVIPVGVKGSYYFDELFDANSKWDFYAAASAGFAIVSSSWEKGYDGDKHHFNHGNSVFLDLHAGAEYHFSNKVGVYLDLSSGVSAIGLAFHQSR